MYKKIEEGTRRGTRKNKKRELHLSNSLLVTAKGVEPSTAGAEIQCSIQLSYAAIILRH